MLNLMEFRTYDNNRCAFNPTHIKNWTQHKTSLEVLTRDNYDRIRTYSLHVDELPRVRELTVSPENRVDPPPMWFLVIIDFDWPDSYNSYIDGE